MTCTTYTFNTTNAYVNGIETSIHDFCKQDKAYCKNGHELCGCQGEHNLWYYRHVHACDIQNNVTEWHAEWQRHFTHTEIWFPMKEGQHKNRRADIVEGNYVLEIQHSDITKEEVDNRNHDYALHGKQVYWVIDCSNSSINGDILTIDSTWKCESFLNCEYIYINHMDKVYKISPNSVKSLTVHVFPIDKQVWIESIKSQSIIYETPIQHTIYLKQQGAGNGKTWGIIKMLSRDDFQHYKRFIYGSKQHSNRVILKNELVNQLSNLGFTNISDLQEKNKKFIIHYTNKIGNDCSIVIATIDSFIYAVGDKTLNSFDMFPGIAQSIVEGHLDADVRGKIQYANINPKLNAETLYIIDEAQDLPVCYANAILKIMKKTNMDVYVVGDKLQSISNELNALTTFQHYTSHRDSSINVYNETASNVCRRFTHPHLIDFVNHMTPFEKYDLPITTPYITCEDTHQVVFPILAKKDGDDIIEDTVNKIMHDFKKEVREHHYCPENFLFVFPVVSCNPLANMLEIAINEFWIDQIKNPYYKTIPYWKNHNTDEYYRYSVFHKSQEGTSINLDESAHATRMVSIHSSKGDGREVVFVVGVTDYKLKKFSGISDTLKYDSLLYVALTRMKNTLYIIYIDDEIGKKIKTWLTKTKQEFEVTTITIKNSINTNEIINLGGNELNKLVQLDFIKSNTTTQLIDMSHHNIRFGILTETIRELLENEVGKQQIKTQKNISCRTCVKICTTWYDYNTCIKDNANKEKMKTIPLLKINERTYNYYLDIIIKFIDHICIQCKYDIKLCPFELIILYYMNQITQNHRYSKITMLELYNIIDIYINAFKHHFEGHDDCLCKKTFADNENENSITDYLNSHYEQMKQIDIILKQIKELYPKTDWNTDHHIKYTSSKFEIISELPFIGYNESNVILCYISPKLDQMNINTFKTRAIVDIFIIKNEHESKNFEKYNNKQIVVTIIATNLHEPYFMIIDVDELQVKENIAKSMYNHYVVRNNEMYNLYKTYRKQHDPKDFIKNCIANWIDFKEKNSCKVPFYIDSFMDDLNRQCRKCKDINIFLQDLDETFLDKLNDELMYSIKDFLKL